MTIGLPVSLDEVAQDLEMQMEESSAFINSLTGEVVIVSHEELAMAEEDEDLDLSDLPAWQAEMMPKVIEIVTEENWKRLPSKSDIHEWDIMRRFGNAVDDDDLGERIDRAIHGRGAFRMFRDAIERAGQREDWFAFRQQALRKIAQEALEELGIPYK
jgi:hypothetical protein